MRGDKHMSKKNTSAHYIVFQNYRGNLYFKDVGKGKGGAEVG